MNFQRQVSRALDEEHRANLDLLGRVEAAFARPARPEAMEDPELGRLVATLARHLEHEVGRHFDFEEVQLFPRLQAGGEGDLGGLLEEEHRAIREVIVELLPLANAAGAGTLDRQGWESLKRSALEMAERLGAHIQKETMALLPVLDDLLDEDTDRELAFQYATA